MISNRHLSFAFDFLNADTIVCEIIPNNFPYHYMQSQRLIIFLSADLKNQSSEKKYQPIIVNI